MNNYSKTTSFGNEKIHGNLSVAKLLFLIVIAVFFSYGPLSLFAPVPLAFGYLLYGRAKTLISSLVIVFALVGASGVFQIGPMLGGTFFMSLVFAVFISEGILQNIHPSKALFKSGLIIMIGVLLFVFGYSLIAEPSLEGLVNQFVATTFENFEKQNEQLLATNTPEAKAIKDFLSNPGKLAQDIMNWSFAFVFISVFLSLWIGSFLVLKNSLVWRQYIKYRYSFHDLLRFKLHDNFVYLLIVGLVLYVGSEHIGLSNGYEVLGGNILYCMAVFYFFQGFGIYLAFLDYLKIFGFMRSVLVVTTFMLAWKIVVVVGIFDLWINFRKFFNKKNIDEGDNL